MAAADDLADTSHDSSLDFIYKSGDDAKKPFLRNSTMPIMIMPLAIIIENIRYRNADFGKLNISC